MGAALGRVADGWVGLDLGGVGLALLGAASAFRWAAPEL